MIDNWRRTRVHYDRSVYLAVVEDAGGGAEVDVAVAAELAAGEAGVLLRGAPHDVHVVGRGQPEAEAVPVDLGAGPSICHGRRKLMAPADQHVARYYCCTHPPADSSLGSDDAHRRGRSERPLPPPEACTTRYVDRSRGG
jgi:hypothetical protein